MPVTKSTVTLSAWTPQESCTSASNCLVHVGGQYAASVLSQSCFDLILSHSSNGIAVQLVAQAERPGLPSPSASRTPCLFWRALPAPSSLHLLPPLLPPVTLPSSLPHAPLPSPPSLFSWSPHMCLIITSCCLSFENILEPDRSYTSPAPPGPSRCGLAWTAHFIRSVSFLSMVISTQEPE